MVIITFSIIVPVYKAERYLDKCVESVLAQTYTDFELILVDDGSPDACPQKCDEWAKADDRIKVIHKENGGLSEARNFGLEMAAGEYVAFLDSDDFWDDTTALAEAYNAIETDNLDILIIGIKKFYQQSGRYTCFKKPTWGSVGKDLVYSEKIRYIMQNNYFIASACDKIVRTQLIKQERLRFIKGQCSEDIEWSLKLLRCRPNIGLLNNDFYVYRQQNSDSLSSNLEKRHLEHMSDVIMRYAPIRSDDSEGAVCLKHFLAQEYVLWLTITDAVPKKEIKELLREMRRYWYLLDYNWYPYVRKVCAIKWLGFTVVRWALIIYRRVK